MDDSTTVLHVAGDADDCRLAVGHRRPGELFDRLTGQLRAKLGSDFEERRKVGFETSGQQIAKHAMPQNRDTGSSGLAMESEVSVPE